LRTSGVAQHTGVDAGDASLGTPDALGAGDLSIGCAEAQPQQHLSILVHLEPPVAHRVGLPEKAGRLTRSKKFETAKRYVAGGSITPRFGWLHYAAIELALYARELTPARIESQEPVW